jgi:hypothetical protein
LSFVDNSGQLQLHSNSSNFALKPRYKNPRGSFFCFHKETHTRSQRDKPTQKSNQIKLKSKFTKTAAKPKYASTPPFVFLAPPTHSNPQITPSLASNSQSTHKILSTKGKHNMIEAKGRGA